MADSFPISNALNVAISVHLGDPVSGADNGIAASSDGVDFSATHRNLILQKAYNELAVRLINLYGAQTASIMCEGIRVQQSITFASGGTSINKDYITSIALLKSDNNEFNLRDLNDLKQDLDPYLDAGYAIEGGKLYAFQRSAGTLSQLTSGTGTLYYIKSDRLDVSTGAVIAVNSTSDTQIDGTWHNFLIEYSAYRLAEAKASGEYLEKATIYKQSADNILPTKKT